MFLTAAEGSSHGGDPRRVSHRAEHEVSRSGRYGEFDEETDDIAATLARAPT
jgi:hypothetical protein